MAVDRQVGGARGLRSGDGEKGRELPLVSVIVVVYRDREALGEILDNLCAMRGASMEVVVIDGGSDDGTREMLRARDADVDFWSSDPDSGIYEAMNKGLEAAQGRYVLHINAGDRLLRLPTEALEAGVADVIACRVKQVGQEDFVPRVGWPMRFFNTWHHQGTFYRRSTHPGYDPSYKVFGDFDLNQRMTRAGLRVEISDAVVAEHSMDGMSHQDVGQDETMRCMRSNFGASQVLTARCWYAVRNPMRLLAKRVRRAREVGPRRVAQSLLRALRGDAAV